MPLKSCNVENMRTFVEALRSGKFTQGSSQLEFTRDDGVTRNCCLGVACRVASENGVELPIKLVPSSSNYANNSYVAFDDETSFLPHSVVAWLGLRDTEHEYRPNNPDLIAEDGTERTATKLNDVYHYTFSQIADCFERTFLTP